MNKRNLRIGMVVFTLFLVVCAGQMMIADATEAKENTVALLQNADANQDQLTESAALDDLQATPESSAVSTDEPKYKGSLFFWKPAKGDAGGMDLF